jgi:hypothetical protein
VQEALKNEKEVDIKMAIVVASGITISTAANTKSADVITGRNQYVGKGRLQLVAKGSAAGMNITLNCGGVALADDNPIPYSGTTGTVSVNDNVMIDQVVAGGRVEMFLRNTTGGALTTDYIVYFTPM